MAKRPWLKKKLKKTRDEVRPLLACAECAELRLVGPTGLTCPNGHGAICPYDAVPIDPQFTEEERCAITEHGGQLRAAKAELIYKLLKSLFPELSVHEHGRFPPVPMNTTKAYNKTCTPERGYRDLFDEEDVQ